ncbi:MAG: hypothetical protein S0880_20515 [Actinomycetota bacterium]|nr:hypothetical protein [Actinomycetota bacterium]
MNTDPKPARDPRGSIWDSLTKPQRVRRLAISAIPLLAIGALVYALGLPLLLVVAGMALIALLLVLET